MISKYTRLFSEASFLNSSLERVIINMTKVISKRIGKKLIGSPDAIFDVIQDGIKLSGVKYYIGNTGRSLRFNWLRTNNSELYSIDVFYIKKVLPIASLNVQGYNINQIIESIVAYILGDSYIEESTSMKEGLFDKVKGTFTKKEVKKEIPVVSKKTESDIVRFNALTGNQIFEKIERDLRFILESDYDNLLIVSGDPAVGKTVLVKKILQEIGGQVTQPSLKILPPVGSKKLNDILKSEDTTVQAKMRELADMKVKFSPYWSLGSQNVGVEEFFIEMYQSNGSVLLYDDADTIFTLKENRLLLKQAADTKPFRRIKSSSKLPYINLGAKVGIMPKEFTYSGKIIIITNNSAGTIEDSIRTRARLTDVDLNPVQFMERLKSIIPDIQKNEASNIPVSYFWESYDWLYDIFVNKKLLKKFDMRSFVSGVVKEKYILRNNPQMWEIIAATNIKTKYPDARFRIG